MIGTQGEGNNYPGASYPFGMVQLSPDLCQAWTGYKYNNNDIVGFSHTHLSGAGCEELGDFLVMPIIGPTCLAPTNPKKPQAGYSSTFSHQQESASPGYYSVVLKDYDVKAELTATAHAGFHKYTFPESDQAHLILDLAHGIGTKPIEATLKMEDARSVSGHRRDAGWVWDRGIYFYAKFSRPFDAHRFVTDGTETLDAVTASGKAIKASFDFKTKKGEVVLVRVGLSPVSVEAARKNLATEIPEEDFESVVTSTRAEWNRQLGTIQIETPDPEVRQVFYTALYHSLLAPNFFNDVDGSYCGVDKQVHNDGFQYYSTFSLWDTYRAWHPLATIIQPQRVNDFIRSFLAFYEQQTPHALPIWPLYSIETGCMPGYHSLPVILDAYQKGFRGYDVEKVYAAMRATAIKGREFEDEFRDKGYISTETTNHENSTVYKQSVSRTLEYSYDDWCMARMAHLLGKTEDEELFLKWAGNYRNVFDPKTKFMRGRTAEGAFITPFDPKVLYAPDYTEANAWQYTFFVPHDPQGLIDLMGGDQPFIEKLDQMFAEDSVIKPGGISWMGINVKGLIGQYCQGNEPDQNVPYLYIYAGAPYKTQEMVRRIMTNFYTTKPDGLCGNDDLGEMSAWYVLSALGFYPQNPADGNYIIGSPLVDKAVIHLDAQYYGGETFTIVAKNNNHENPYIQSATLNGLPLTRSYFTHAELVKGGVLVFQMGPKPNKEWGQAPASRPTYSTASSAAK